MSLFTKAISILSGSLIGEIGDIAKSYFNKEISQAEAESRTKIAIETYQAKVEEAWAKTASENMESVQATLRVSPIMARAYAFALISQLFVLVWYQLGASAYLVLTGTPWPSAGATVEWAYLLVGAMLGAGPFVFKRGISASG